VAENKITHFWKIKTLTFFLLPFGSQRGKVYGRTTTLTSNRLVICLLNFFLFLKLALAHKTNRITYSLLLFIINRLLFSTFASRLQFHGAFKFGEFSRGNYSISA